MAGAACGGDGQRRGEGVGKGTFKPSDGKERLGEERWWPGRGPGPEEREPGACGTGALGPDSRSCREIGARGVCARACEQEGRLAEDVVTGLRSPSRDFPASGVRVSDSSAAASFSPSSPHPPIPLFISPPSDARCGREDGETSSSGRSRGGDGGRLLPPTLRPGSAQAGGVPSAQGGLAALSDVRTAGAMVLGRTGLGLG